MSQGEVAPVLAVPAERRTGLPLRKLVAGEQALAATAQIWWGLAAAQAPLAGILVGVVPSVGISRRTADVRQPSVLVLAGFRRLGGSLKGQCCADCSASFYHLLCMSMLSHVWLFTAP